MIYFEGLMIRKVKFWLALAIIIIAVILASLFILAE
jgi:hypothetical protein